MTPEQATLAAGILSTHLPSDPGRMADALAVIEYLRRMAGGAFRWRYAGGTLYVADPCGRSATIARPSRFAATAGDVLAAPGERVDVSHVSAAGRPAINSQRYALADRLAQRRFAALADAVRVIHLEQRGASVFAIYDPDGVPLRFEQKLSLSLP
jgi:hypothetical protein